MINIFHDNIISYTLPWLFLKLTSNVKPSYLIHHFNFSKCQPVQPINFKHSSLVMFFTELLTNIYNHVVNTKMVIKWKKGRLEYTYSVATWAGGEGRDWMSSLKPIHYTEQHIRLSLQSSITKRLFLVNLERGLTASWNFPIGLKIIQTAILRKQKLWRIHLPSPLITFKLKSQTLLVTPPCPEAKGQFTVPVGSTFIFPLLCERT